jgi:hypothetical protein
VDDALAVEVEDAGADVHGHADEGAVAQQPEVVVLLQQVLEAPVRAERRHQTERLCHPTTTTVNRPPHVIGGS